MVVLDLIGLLLILIVPLWMFAMLSRKLERFEREVKKNAGKKSSNNNKD